jgi:hypothetical protein
MKVKNVYHDITVFISLYFNASFWVLVYFSGPGFFFFQILVTHQAIKYDNNMNSLVRRLKVASGRV